MLVGKVKQNLDVNILMGRVFYPLGLSFSPYSLKSKLFRIAWTFSWVSMIPLEGI